MPHHKRAEEDVFSDELSMTSVVDLVANYRARKLSPVEATRAALEQIEERNRALNAFIIVCADEALTAAKESEARWRQGKPIGLVDVGTPSIKDVLLMKGHPTRRGSLTSSEAPETEDAPATARLREQGTVLIGKTTTPELGWKAMTDSPLTGITRNPWDVDKTRGGRRFRLSAKTRGRLLVLQRQLPQYGRITALGSEKSSLDLYNCTAILRKFDDRQRELPL
jgi:aspartyl-tRNA(Asn)/glutamyl-tRNA(Gln) amidotransferase subunit A